MISSYTKTAQIASKKWNKMEEKNVKYQ